MRFCARQAGVNVRRIFMINYRKYRLALKRITLAVEIIRLARVVIALLSMAINYSPKNDCQVGV